MYKVFGPNFFGRDDPNFYGTLFDNVWLSFVGNLCEAQLEIRQNAEFTDNG